MYRPREGDLIIFRSEKHGPHNHIGIVVAERYPKVYTIEDNTGNSYFGNDSSTLIGKVEYKEYSAMDKRIMGYCINGGTSNGVVPYSSSKGVGEGR